MGEVTRGGNIEAHAFSRRDYYFSVTATGGRATTMRRRLIALLLLAAPAAAGPVVPRIVLQTALYVDVAAWTPDDRFVVTAAAATRNVTIWDARQRVIVDRLTLPTPADFGSDLLVLTGLDLAGDVGFVHGRRLSIYTDQPDHLQDWRVDLTARTVVALPARTTAKAKDPDLFAHQIAALTTLYQNGTDMTDAAAVAMLPALPRSHDGRWSIARVPDGLKLTGPGGKWATITPSPAVALGDAALAPDGSRLAVVVSNETDDEQHKGTLIRTFDVATGRNLRWLRTAGDYGFVRWADQATLLLTTDSTNDSRDEKYPDGTALPAGPKLVDAATLTVRATLPPRCYVTVLGDKLVGAGVGNCRAVKADRDLWSAGETWTKLPSRLPPGAAIDLLAASPDGSSLALALSAEKDAAVLALDVVKGVTQGIHIDGGAFAALAFAPDSRSLFVAANGQISRVRLDHGATGDSPPIDALGPSGILPQMLASDGRTLMTAGVADTVVNRFDLASARPLPPLEFPNVIAGGFSGGGLMWTASAGEGIRLWDARTGETVLTTYLFGNDRWFTVAPDGRYDTNLGPDSAHFRWLVSDRPWQSLSPQTFMRDYYEPKLTARLLGCRAAGTCAAVFKPLRPIGDLNRVLPQVTIEAIEPGATPDIAVVTVAARSGVDGAERSGVYNLRLFRGGQLVGQFPAVLADTADLPGWRAANAVPVAPDGVARTTFAVRLPTGATAEKVAFTAYAFNDDRVKGDSARRSYDRPPVAPRPRRAFVVAIGIDAYAEPRLHLRFAAADARLVARQLAALPGYAVHSLVLTGETGSTHATKALIRAALGVLAGDPAARGVLAAAGVDASGLDTATPDDMVVIAYAGHGWAARDNDFFIIPSDGRWADGADDPDRASLIASGELTRWLAGVDAGEMAIVIDACQSAAAVVADGFKPGPMGDRGLGQLAYDKRIRILAGSQSSAEALEDPRLGHGLLTWALAGEGLDGHGFGRADSNSDGTITLDEWLGYAVGRLPTMSADLASGKLAADTAGRGFVFMAAGARPQPQEPELFNFIAQPVPVVLRRRGS